MFSVRGVLLVVTIYLGTGCLRYTDPAPAAGHDNEMQAGTPVTEHFGLSEQDIQYIDLIVPEYAEIILYREATPEAIALSERLIAWFRSIHASIELREVSSITDRQPPANRQFSIEFIGDHRYVVRVFHSPAE